MFTTPRKPKVKDETPHAPKKSTDDIIKRNLTNLTTPRPYAQKTTNDIYGAKKTLNVSTPKVSNKTRTTEKSINASSKQNQLKPSSSEINSAKSSVSTLMGQRSNSKTTDTKAQKLKNEVNKKELAKNNNQQSANNDTKPIKDIINKVKSTKDILKEKSKKTLLNTNVTVNSPVVKKKTYDTKENTKEYKNENVDRQRTKTRTLDDSEAKILTIDAVDNNAEMQNLTRKLSAKPKAFYVDLKDDQNKIKNEKISEDEYSYEDDFESYESDFDSYHSDESSNSDNKTGSEGSDEERDDVDDKLDTVIDSLKETKDEEKKLDSGNFDLRDPQRSAQKTKPMDFIVEQTEESSDKKTSLTDEGFQDMSSSSATSSMRTMHVDVLERPLLIDFSKLNKSKAKQTRVRREQRAKELLEMITLHTMSYSLFELNPIPYNIYMATYGRANYKQSEVQTNDDNITEEVQTENVDTENKWTQHPVKFSKNSIISQKQKSNNENAIEKFTFLNNSQEETVAENDSDDYKINPLRIYLEQKNGVGIDHIMAYEKYKSKLDNHDVDMKLLKRFLKRVESRIVKALSTITDNSTSIDTNQKSNYPFSETYTTVSPKDINVNDFKQYKIVDIIFSDSKSNLAMIVHKKTSSDAEKSIICLWDISSNLEKPLKILIAVDELSLGRFRGGADGIFVAALKDGSINLWDLSEKATYTEEDPSAELQEVKQLEQMSQIEIDREWNLRNIYVGYHNKPASKESLHSCVYTSSAYSIYSKEMFDSITGLELLHEGRNLDSGRKIIGQICALLRIGIITMWSIIQEKKTNNQVVGKAYWSRTKLEKSLQINLADYIDKPISDEFPNRTFSLNAAKRRINRRKSEKCLLNEFSRPKSAVNVDNDRPASAASKKNRSFTQIDNRNSWDSGLVCKDLRVMKNNGRDHYLIAKNCGEVLSLIRSMGAAKVERFEVASNGSSISKLEVSPHGLPYFLAATDCGTLNLCSLAESRVLLTLDCRNGPVVASPLTSDVERYNTDNKGRFIGTIPLKRQTPQPVTLEFQTTLKSLHWLPTNPCSIITLSQDGVVNVWQLERSDICPSFTTQSQAVVSSLTLENLAFVTKAGDVDVHKLTNNKNLKDNLILFQKYVSLL